MDLRSALENLASKYDAIGDALLVFCRAAAVVQDAEVTEADLAHLPALAAQIRENILPVFDALRDAIPGELGEYMRIAQEFAGE